MSNKSDEKQGGTKEIGDDAASMHQEDGTSAASDDATMTPTTRQAPTTRMKATQTHRQATQTTPRQTLTTP